jgi:nitroimidazol reductase NimA-like FMN-containing flavoprotein (pyridoxamine 5'-phosphate oxidase superfamily)
MPRRVRPKLPENWHVPNDPKLWITWAHASDKLAREKVYWVSTASPRGRPHAVPVWGIWRKNMFYFETDPKSVKGRNLSSNPSLIVHVQDGMDTVIVKGNARREKTARVLSWLRKDYTKKYRYTPDWSNDRKQIVFRVEPGTVHAWKAPRMHRSLVKFIF